MATFLQRQAWIDSLPAAQRDLVLRIAQLQTAQMNAENDTSRNVFVQQKRFNDLGGTQALLQSMQQLQSDPALYNQWQANAVRTGGLGQGQDILAALAAFATGVNLAGGAAGAGGSAGSGGGLTALPAGGMTATGELGSAGLSGMTGAAVDAGLAGSTGITNAALGAGGVAGGFGTGAANVASLPAGVMSETGGYTGWQLPQSGLPQDGGILSNITNAVGGSNVLGAIASGAASLGGAYLTSKAAKEAQAKQEAAAASATKTMQDALATGSAEQKTQFLAGQNALTSALAAGKTYLDPYAIAGRGALTAQQDLMGLGVGGADAALTSLQNSPGYQFRLQQGQRGLDAGISARGGMGSGKSAVAASQYNQNFASGEYGNRLAQLSGLAGQGLNASSNLAGMESAYGGNIAGMGTAYGNTKAGQDMTTASNIANIQTGLGQAQGAAGIASANAMQSGILGAGNALSGYLNPEQTKKPIRYDPVTGAPIYA